MRRISSKMLISRVNRLTVDFSLTLDGKNFLFTWKGAKCQFNKTHKLKNIDFRSKKG